MATIKIKFVAKESWVSDDGKIGRSIQLAPEFGNIDMDFNDERLLRFQIRNHLAKMKRQKAIKLVA